LYRSKKSAKLTRPSPNIHETSRRSLLPTNKSVSKQLVDYSRGHREAHCGKAFEDDDGYCHYFIEPRSGLATELGAWEKVEGQISRVFCCRLFAKAHREQDGN
jgi:hypothetical protein